MNTSLYIGTTGINAYQKKLDTVANNLAHSETIGYKKREASFEENLAVSIENQKAANKEVGRMTPLGIRTGFGVHVNGTNVNMDQGAPKETNNPLDLMILGKGFFPVGRQQGENLEIVYTRDGAFQKVPTANGSYQLTNAQGYALLDNNGNPIEVADQQDFSVQENGMIAGTNQQIGLVEFINPQQLVNDGGNVFRFTGNGDEILVGPAARIQQGYLESSNVDLSKEVTDLIATQRGYQFNSRSITYADQMMGIVNNIIRS